MEIDQPLVSVLMTAFNREKYIGEAIDSVLASGYTHFELIIVDDCSSDKTVDIARSYESKDTRVRVYQNERNLGDYINRNKAAGYGSGKYFKYLDSDDIIYPQSLSMFVDGMEKNPDAALGIMSGAVDEKKKFPYLLSPSEAYHYHFYEKGVFDTGPSALIFRAGSFREIGGFSGKRYVGDSEINLRLAARWPVVMLPPALIYWREHEGQEIRAGSISTGYLELELPMIREELNKKECPLSEKEKKDIIGNLKAISARKILKLALVQKHPSQAISIYRKLTLKPIDIFKALFLKKKR
jgi:glycosyltransferase involved in cell wall biosynthesis